MNYGTFSRKHIGSPFVLLNTRIWKSKPKSQRFGPNAWHKDGFALGHLKNYGVT
jgi:hypothetical protein